MWWCAGVNYWSSLFVLAVSACCCGDDDDVTVGAMAAAAANCCCIINAWYSGLLCSQQNYLHFLITEVISTCNCWALACANSNCCCLSNSSSGIPCTSQWKIVCYIVADGGNQLKHIILTSLSNLDFSLLRF